MHEAVVVEVELAHASREIEVVLAAIPQPVHAGEHLVDEGLRAVPHGAVGVRDIGEHGVVVGVETTGDVIARDALAGHGGVAHPVRVPGLSIRETMGLNAKPSARSGAGSSVGREPFDHPRAIPPGDISGDPWWPPSSDSYSAVGSSVREAPSRCVWKNFSLFDPTITMVGAVRPAQRSAGSGSALLQCRRAARSHNAACGSSAFASRHKWQHPHDGHARRRGTPIASTKNAFAAADRSPAATDAAIRLRQVGGEGAAGSRRRCTAARRPRRR